MNTQELERSNSSAANRSSGMGGCASPIRSAQAQTDMELITRDERNLLLYFETQAVDYGGTLESVRMNADDFAIAKRWNEAGFVQFGRIALSDITKHNGIARDHWCVLSEEAWKLAHAERLARCERVMATLKVERKGLLAEQDA